MGKISKSVEQEEREEQQGIDDKMIRLNCLTMTISMINSRQAGFTSQYNVLAHTDMFVEYVKSGQKIEPTYRPVIDDEKPTNNKEIN